MPTLLQSDYIGYYQSNTKKKWRLTVIIQLTADAILIYEWQSVILENS